MLTEPTLDRLRALHLGAMADAYRGQLHDPAIGTLSFDERVGLLVDAEHLSRDNRKLARRLKEAKLRMPQACLEDIEYAPRRELDRPLSSALPLCRWLRGSTPPRRLGSSKCTSWARSPNSSAGSWNACGRVWRGREHKANVWAAAVRDCRRAV